MMPPPKFLFAPSCVAQATTSSKRTSLTLYFDKAEIKALHPHFTDPLVDAILAEKATEVVPSFVNDARLRMGSKGLTVKTYHTLRQYDPTTNVEKTVPHMTAIDDGVCYYWLRTVKKKKPSKKKAKKKSK